MNYSSYFLHCYTAAPSPSYEVHPEKVINQDEMDALCPLDPTTGKRCEPLVRALDPACSESERQSLLAPLQLVKTSSRYQSCLSSFCSHSISLSSSEYILFRQYIGSAIL